MDGIKTPKTKTAMIIADLDSAQYKREPMKEILLMTKNELKTVMIARHGMLECGKNFRGSLPDKCPTCDVIDDENHRLNYCKRWEKTNLYMSPVKYDFNNVYSDDNETVNEIIDRTAKVWNVQTGSGGMYQNTS